jgi:hypothetical protein
LFIKIQNAKFELKYLLPNALNEYPAINMPGVSSTDASAQKGVKGIEIVDQYGFCQHHFSSQCI